MNPIPNIHALKRGVFKYHCNDINLTLIFILLLERRFKILWLRYTEPSFYFIPIREGVQNIMVMIYWTPHPPFRIIWKWEVGSIFPAIIFWTPFPNGNGKSEGRSNYHVHKISKPFLNSKFNIRGDSIFCSKIILNPGFNIFQGFHILQQDIELGFKILHILNPGSD